MTRVRKPAVAGTFYPATASELHTLVTRYLSEARHGGPSPKAIIAPHAGYVCSGPIAASAYATLEPLRDTIRTVVLVGPAHRVALRGLAVSGAEEFATPLGPVPVDRDAVVKALALPQVRVLDEAHDQEHSLEVQLPFLQEVLGSFRIVPLVVGSATTEQVAEVIETLWGGRETLIVISSDLSHYHTYDRARKIDAETTKTIEAAIPSLESEQACGCKPLNGLLEVARQRGMRVRALDVRNSGDTLGSRDQVVGYGAFVLDEGADE